MNLNLKKPELSYLAAIIDGEGCITIRTMMNRKVRDYRCALQVSNTDLRLLKWIKSKIAYGTIYTRLVENRKPCYIWEIRDNKCKLLLEEVYQFLVGKKWEADIIFEFRDTYKEKYNVKTGGVPLEILEKRKNLFFKLKKRK